MPTQGKNRYNSPKTMKQYRFNAENGGEPMARLNVIKGQVDEFVGSSWKGTDYIKTYIPPSNSRSEGQVAVRTVFQHCGPMGKQLNQEVLHSLHFPKPQKMSEYN
jgi:hypothetical protein